MKRRNFIRVAGGGVVLATATLTGCAQTTPAEAIEAWRSAPREADPRRWIVSHAILAPNAHNLQSWLVDLGTPNEIVLRCDLKRLLPETDPFSRQIMMSQGTFLELLDLAARERGLRADIELFPSGVSAPADQLDGRAIARIRLTADPAVKKDPLFAQILNRRTNRSAYDPARPVPAQAWKAMADAAVVNGAMPLRFGWAGAEQTEVLKRHRHIATEAWRIELTTERTVLESYKVLRVGAAEIARHRDGVSLLDAMPVLMNRLGLLDRSQAPAPGDFALKAQIDGFNKKIASTPGFLWLITDANDRATQVAAGRAYARVQLAATAHGVSMHPLQQALQEYPEQAGPHTAIRGLLGVVQPAHTVQMWARVGFAPEVSPAPRRGLAAHLAAA
jgi:hypothetical protein